MQRVAPGEHRECLLVGSEPSSVPGSQVLTGVEVPPATEGRRDRSQLLHFIQMPRGSWVPFPLLQRVCRPLLENLDFSDIADLFQQVYLYLTGILEKSTSTLYFSEAECKTIV